MIKELPVAEFVTTPVPREHSPKLNMHTVQQFPPCALCTQHCILPTLWALSGIRVFLPLWIGGPGTPASVSGVPEGGFELPLVIGFVKIVSRFRCCPDNSSHLWPEYFLTACFSWFLRSASMPRFASERLPPPSSCLSSIASLFPARLKGLSFFGWAIRVILK